MATAVLVVVFAVISGLAFARKPGRGRWDASPRPATEGYEQ
jgi:hypothetical protein